MTDFEREIAIQIIQIGGFGAGGMLFGLCLGLGMWASGVRMTIATVEIKEPTP